MQRPLLFIFTIALFTSAYSRTINQGITLAQCIEQALETNYSIKLSRNNLQIAESNHTISPFLPSVSGAMKQSQDAMDSKEIFSDHDVSKSYVNNILGADVSLNWRLFDGLAMFSQYDNQQKLLAAGEINLRSSIEELVADLAEQYYHIATQENRLKTMNLYLEISTMRYNQTKEKYSIGAVSGLEMKQAKIDLNADSSRIVMQRQLLQNSYVKMYEIMNIGFDSNISLQDSITPNATLTMDELVTQSQQNNTSILLARNGEERSSIDLRIARSSFYPTLDFNAAYKFNRSDNSSYSSLYSRYNGPTWGFSLSVPLFNRLETTKKIREAKIRRNNSKILCEQAEQMVLSSIIQQYNVYRKNLTMINFEQESSEAALLNMEAALERYRLGNLSGTEFREIQRSYLEATDRMLDAKFQVKLSEINLLYLAGLILSTAL